MIRICRAPHAVVVPVGGRGAGAGNRHRDARPQPDAGENLARCGALSGIAVVAPGVGG